VAIFMAGLRGQTGSISWLFILSNQIEFLFRMYWHVMTTIIINILFFSF